MFSNVWKLSSMLLAASGFLFVSQPFAANAQDNFIGEIRMVGFNFAPKGWTLCGGQLLAISSNQALFSLWGTLYGGDGRTTFGTPDFRGRGPIGSGQGPGLSNRPMGQKGGVERVTINVTQMPSHSHTGTAHAFNGAANVVSPSDAAWAQEGRTELYSSTAPNVDMVAGSVTVSNTGGGQPIGIMQPYQVVYFACALDGLYPPRN